MSGENPKGPYTVWVNHGYEGWHPTDCETLEEAIQLETYGSSFVIQKPAVYKIIESDLSRQSLE